MPRSCLNKTATILYPNTEVVIHLEKSLAIFSISQPNEGSESALF